MESTSLMFKSDQPYTRWIICNSQGTAMLQSDNQQYSLDLSFLHLTVTEMMSVIDAIGYIIIHKKIDFVQQELATFLKEYLSDDMLHKVTPVMNKLCVVPPTQFIQRISIDMREILPFLSLLLIFNFL